MANWRDDIELIFQDIVGETTGLNKVVADKLNLLNVALADFPVQDTFRWTSGPQVFPLGLEAVKIEDVFVNMKKLDKSQYKHTYNKIEITDTLDATNSPEVIFVKYTTPSSFDDVYGIKKDRTHAAPEWERVGKNMSLHASLPVQSQMKRCLLNDDGTVNYYLDPNDSTKKTDGTTANLDGTDGQYMVEIPRHFQRFDTFGDMLYVWISLKPFPGCFESPKHYVSAGKAVLNRSNGKLSCVINFTADYRGGNNQAAWDAQPNTMLGKPTTVQSRIDFHNYANNRGEGWEMMQYEARKTIAWLITIEYATSSHQSAVDNTTTPEGYKKGGLGNGPVDIVNAEWDTFNNRYPVFEIGLTNSLGNNSGEVAITLQDFPLAGQTRNTQVNSYRGIENFWGDIWEWTDGINIERSNGGTVSKIYKAIGAAHSNNDYDGYKKIGEMPATNGYIRDIVFGPKGDILPTNSNGASASTYFTDYYYRSDSDGLRGLLFGGIVRLGALAGSLCVHSAYAPSSASTALGSRLCFFPK